VDVVWVASLFPVNVPLGFNQNGIFGRLEPTVLLLPLRIQYVPAAALVNLYLSLVGQDAESAAPSVWMRGRSASNAVPAVILRCDPQHAGGVPKRESRRKKEKNRISSGSIYYQRV
jgi:hypothetical protein